MSSDEFRTAVRRFVHFLPSIDRCMADEFSAEYDRHLARIADYEASHPALAETLRPWFFAATEDMLSHGLLHPRARQKPLGYAGDYLLIDWIHTAESCDSIPGARWDDHFHRQAAPCAVRNRGMYFSELFAAEWSRRGGELSVLNLACGPCRDVAHAIARTGGAAAARIHCVDQEPAAIEYAQRTVGCSDQANVTFQVGNVLRLRLRQSFDLVWSAGLFDYLSDRLAVALLRRMWAWTAAGGSLVFGQFHPRNPTRSAQEWCLDWRLIHRDEAQCRRLCIEAGIPAHAITVETEPLGVIVFVRASRVGQIV